MSCLVMFCCVLVCAWSPNKFEPNILACAVSSDHAGIATQLLVTRQLHAEGSSPEGIGRDAFLRRAWEWQAEKGGYIMQQMRRMGASADWSREKFTLQPDMSNAVTEAFLRLHDRGLIYRDSYMVNWSPHLQTAVSDLEVEHCEEMGVLYHFKYVLQPLDSSTKAGAGAGAAAVGGVGSVGAEAEAEAEFIAVATTRPETILGDAAVCVHPEDPRYRHLVGRSVRVPMSGGRLIPGEGCCG
jgi:valyl-tRNA synthetase